MQNTKQNKYSKDNWCVIVPTYNNEKTLSKVISEILKISSNIIVINDGSTDSTSHVLENYTNKITLITHSKNQGKGRALRNGFQHAINNGFHYAITIDSDGQHYPEDIYQFLNEITVNPESLVVGARDMTQDGIPKKSSFGNKFSNFWFWTETGISLSDTQTGFRLYPLDKIKNITFLTNKFEFEIEILVRLAWRDVSVKEIPIKVKYDKYERVSHFRPFQDFARISILNTILFTIALLYYIPLRFLYLLFGKLRIKNLIQEFFNQEGSSLHKSCSVGFGVFMGIIPIWGFQMLVAVFLSYLLKLNKVIVLISSNISIPPFIPFIIFGSYYFGHFLLGGEKLVFSSDIDLQNIQSVLKQYIFGSFLFAIFSGIIFFCFTYLSLNLSDKLRIKK